MITFYFPRHEFPSNLGDSVVSTFIPKIVNQVFGEKINVITDKFLGSVFLNDPNVESVLSSPGKDDKLITVYPRWHPRVFEFWGKHHQYLMDHPTANIITVNYCLQLGIEELLFSKNLDFSPEIFFKEKKIKNDKLIIGIVPATKLSGKSSPHPNCDGIGFRFNGPKGLESWGSLVKEIKSALDCYVLELSPSNLGLGDKHLGICQSLYELAEKSRIIDYAITTDGGYHHLLNSLKIPLTLFNGSKISKYEFVKLNNAFCPDDLHLQCRFNCPSYFSEAFPDRTNKSISCNLECENMDPIKLAAFSIENIKKLFTHD